MHIAICEDQDAHASIIEGYVKRWAQKQGIRARIARYSSAEEFLLHWGQDNTFDIAFLDIRLGNMNGLELAQRIRRQDPVMLLIFASGLKDYMLHGYEVQAFRFLLKPIKESDCFQALERAAAVVKNIKNDVFLIQQERETVKLVLNDIIYLEADNHYLAVHTLRGEIRYKGNISAAETFLRMPRFCRCHRSFLVNLHHVNTFSRGMVRMDQGQCLPVSRQKWAALNECFLKYYHHKRSGVVL